MKTSREDNIWHQVSHGNILINNVPVLPVVGIAYMLLATLAAGAISPGAGLAVLVLSALAVAVIYVAILHQEEEDGGEGGQSDKKHYDGPQHPA